MNPFFPMQAAPEPKRSFLRRQDDTNFGRTEVVSGAGFETLIDVDVDEHQVWTIVVDTQQVTSDGVQWDSQTGAYPGAGQGAAISSRVVVQVEQGAGNGISTTVFDATDVVAIPVVGNHVKVSATLVSADTVLVPVGGANGLAVPAAANANARALVSAYLAAKMAHFPAPTPAACTYHAIPLFGGKNPFNSTGVSGVVSTVPVRVTGYHATNTSATNTAWLNLLSNAYVIGGGTPPANLVKDVIAIPPNTTVSQTYGGSLPFDRGLAWASSTLPTAVSTAGAPALDVRIELVRQPTILVVSSINQVS